MVHSVHHCVKKKKKKAMELITLLAESIAGVFSNRKKNKKKHKLPCNNNFPFSISKAIFHQASFYWKHRGCTLAPSIFS